MSSTLARAGSTRRSSRQRCAILFRALTHETPSPVAIAVAMDDLCDELGGFGPPCLAGRSGAAALVLPCTGTGARPMTATTDDRMIRAVGELERVLLGGIPQPAARPGRPVDAAASPVEVVDILVELYRNLAIAAALRKAIARLLRPAARHDRGGCNSAARAIANGQPQPLCDKAVRRAASRREAPAVLPRAPTSS
jgi:hypothetical protein